MKDSRQLLTSLLHTVQMGQSGIRSVGHSAVRSALRQELRDQLREYDSIEKEALQLAQARGWTLQNVNPAVRKMAEMMARARFVGGNVDSKIAGMMIQGNTRGMILGIRNLHDTVSPDTQILQLAQRLLDRENINIQKVQPYL